MSHPKGARLGGVYDLETLKGRCWIDPDSGCWHCRTARGRKLTKQECYAGRVWAFGACLTITRAAWLAAHGSVPEGQRIVRVCDSHDCANPKHMRAMTKTQEGAYITAKGQQKRNPRRIMANRLNGSKRAKLTPELRQWAIESQQSLSAAAHGLSVSPSLVDHIRRRARQRVLVGAASVFDLGRVIAYREAA